MSQLQCTHARIVTEPSRWADQIGYRQPTMVQRVAATTKHGQAKRVQMDSANGEFDASAFPAPLVLPGDDLAEDPKYPKQSLRSWIGEKERNKITESRNVVYVARVPRVTPPVDFITKWASPRTVSQPSSDDAALFAPVVEYLSAFFHGLPVKRYGLPLSFVAWEQKRTKAPKRIGLQTSTQCVGIRTRPCPDAVFSHQLSVNDLIDAAISILPDDAYALLLLVEHDVYEDEDDTFICGRAYGGSRIAVVSAARYNPCFDSSTVHTWPASHCQDFVKSAVAAEMDLDDPSPTARMGQTGPLRLAMDAYRWSKPGTDLTGTWLFRLARTTSHELGHCFGLDHCVYYACIMQGTASVAEDLRQPPFLCPIDLAKLTQATSSTPRAHYAALLEFCEKWKQTPAFAAFSVWLQEVISRMQTAQ